MSTEQLSLFEPLPNNRMPKRRYRSPAVVIQALMEFQSNRVHDNDKQFLKLQKYLEKEKPEAELIAYIQMPHPNDRHPAIIFKEQNSYDIAWAGEKLYAWRATGRKSFWAMNTQKWHWISDDVMQQCIQWVDKHVADDRFKWTGLYTNALGNNWCWFNNRGIFS